MLSEIDTQLFPDRCEVIQIVASQRFVYPIMKNGSSSFYEPIQLGLSHNFNVVDINNLTDIQRTHPFVTFLRDPKTRFISGVNTYLQHLNRDIPDLDTDTILWFVDNYLFLNLHYCPQFFWLLNLARLIGPTVEFEFKPMSELSEYTPYHSSAGIQPPTREFLNTIENFNWKRLELYFYLDQVILEMIGQTVSFNTVLDKIKSIPVLNNNVLNKFSQISTVLNALPKT